MASGAAPKESATTCDDSALKGVRRYKKGRSFAETLFGRIRYGKDIVTNEWVAIKENRKWFAKNKVSIKGDPVPEDLFKEIEAHKMLMKQNDVPENILKLLDVVEDDVYIYLILELVDGGDFFSFIQNSHKNIDGDSIVSWEQRIRPIFNDFVKSISWMHSKNICHLDISLENALIKKHGDVIKIIDFGLAKIVEKKDYNNINSIDENSFSNASNANERKKRRISNFQGMNGMNEKYLKWNDVFIRNQDYVEMGPKRIGKLRCMAPEVFDLKRFNPFKADTWSISVLLFMMLLGIPPFDSPDDSQTIFRMITAGRIRDVIIYNQRRHLISNQALDLLIRMFKPQSERIHLDFVKLHPFCVVSDSCPHAKQNTDSDPTSDSSSGTQRCY